MKTCGKCGQCKPVKNFNRQSRTNDGYATICRDCHNEDARELYRRDPSKQRRAEARWKAKHPERALRISRESALRYKYANLDLVHERARITDRKRRERDKAGRDAVTHRARKKRRANKLYRMYESALGSIQRCMSDINYRGRGWQQRFGYTPADLRDHIEALFEPDMSWTNYGHDIGKWEIDHIRPIASFDPYKPKPEEFIRRAFALDNLQPSWTSDNQYKSSHWHDEFWTLESHA